MLDGWRLRRGGVWTKAHTRFIRRVLTMIQKRDTEVIYLRGKEYFSLSQAIKAKVKQAVSFIGKFEDQIAGLARQRDCRGVICGHIHTPADKMIGDIHYLNSGDWVESMTAIVEHQDGRFELVTYKAFLAQFPRSEAAVSSADELDEALALPMSVLV